QRAIADVAFDDRDPIALHRGREVAVAAAREVVDYDHLARRLEQQPIDDVRSDEAGASRDQHARLTQIHPVHFRIPASSVLGCPATAPRNRTPRAAPPATIENGGPPCVTPAPAPPMAPRPTVTPGRTPAFVPTSAPASMRPGRMSRSV